MQLQNFEANVVNKNIKEKFGAVVIDALTNFAKTGIPDQGKLDATWFEHVKHDHTRDAICETLYGARWHYKVGLALLVSKTELYAHVRAQVIDYASICETLLAEMIIHGITKSKFSGSQYQYSDFQKHRSLKGSYNIRKTVEKQTFAWYIEVAHEEKIIDTKLKSELENARTLRNTVHITKLARKNGNYSLKESDTSFRTLQKTINQTKSWFSQNK